MVSSYARLLAPLMLLMLPDPAFAQSSLTHEQALQIQRDCSTIEECIAAMRTETAVNGSGILEFKFAAFGEDAVAPLMQMLTQDPDLRMRSYAGMALSRMPSIDARYLPDLIAASRHGNPMAFSDTGPGWLAIPIGLVRDDPEALRYLFDLAEIYGWGSSSGSVQPAIERSSQTAWLAEARRRLEGFEPDQGSDYLGFVSQLVIVGGHRRPDGYVAPDWLEPALVRIATDPAVNADVRNTAAVVLRKFKNPIALAALMHDAQQQFATLPEWDGRSRFMQMKDTEGLERWERLTDGDFASTIAEIGRFGHAGLEAAAFVRPFLLRPDIPASRASAALTLGQIGDRYAIPMLITASRDRDDWLLAYNAAESLGRLRAEEARDPLQEIAANHWSQAVRNNAERALNMLDGGSFERPGISEDGLGMNDNLGETDHLYMGLVRFKGDDKGGSAECIVMSDTTQRLSQSPVGILRFPRQGAQEIEPSGVRMGDRPIFPNRIANHMPRGTVTVVETLAHGILIGTNAGEFIGGLAYVDDRTRQVELIVPDNVSFMFRHGGRLYALTGLSHLFSSYGEIWEIDLEGDTPQASRRIPLPSEATQVLATASRDIVFVTNDGTFLLTEDGTLRHGDDEATCRRN